MKAEIYVGQTTPSPVDPLTSTCSYWTLHLCVFFFFWPNSPPVGHGLLI